MRGYQLFLDLQPTDPADDFPTVKELESLSDNEFKNSFVQLELPVDFWRIYAETVTDSNKIEYVKSISLNIKSSEYPVDFFRMIKNISFAISHNLTIIIQKKLSIISFTYTVNFAKSFRFHFSEHGGSDNYTLISAHGNMLTLSPIITKLYFCEQVRLWPEEWHMLDDYSSNIVVTLGEGASNKVLQNYEYSRHNTENGDSYVQICVEDFNPIPKQSTRNAAAGMSYRNLLALYLFWVIGSPRF